MPKIAERWLVSVLHTMYVSRTATRSQILKATRLSGSSISRALQVLVKHGTVLKVGELQSSSGRRRDVLNLNSEAGFFIAVDLDGTRIRFAVTNFVGDIRYRWEEDLPIGGKLPVEEVVRGIRLVSKDLSEVQRLRLLAIGIGCPGYIDRNGQITAFNVGWSRVPLEAELRKHFSIPIFIESSTRSALMAERWMGLAQHTGTFIYVMVGQGVGVGIFTNGRFVGGRDQMAGEVGHIQIEPSAPAACLCGKTGCLEAMISSPNVVRRYLERRGLPPAELSLHRISEVFERAREKDPIALSEIARFNHYLGLALSYLVNLLNPELIVLGGDLVMGEDVVLPGIREVISAKALSHFVDHLEIKVSRLGLDICLKGVAALAFRQSLANPALLKLMCRPVAEMHSYSEA